MALDSIWSVFELQVRSSFASMREERERERERRLLSPIFRHQPLRMTFVANLRNVIY